MNNKWIVWSLTIWGTVVTFLTAVLPTVGNLFGLNIVPADILQLGDAVTSLINGIGSVIGTIMIIWGRLRIANAALSIIPK